MNWSFGLRKLTKMYCLLLLSFVGLSAAGQPCNGVLPPGLDKLIKGVDIATVDMVPLDMTASQGFKKSIIDYTCDRGRQWRNPANGETYQLPDQVDMTSLPGGVMNNHVDVFKSSSDVAKTRAASMGVDFINGMFSGSASTKKMSQTITKKERYIADVTAFHSAFRADMAPYWFLNMSHRAHYYIEHHLPETFQANPRAYGEFISYYGTHYFINGKFGGLFRDYMEIRSDLFSRMTEQEIKANAGGSFLKMVKASGGYDGHIKSTSTTFDASTEQFIKYYGGSANFFGDPKSEWRRWEQSVPANPWMFAGQLASITTLINNPKKKAAMQTAIIERIDRAFLKEAIQHYQNLLRKNRDPNVRSRILTELRALGQLSELRYGQLKHDNPVLVRARSALEQPRWFLHNTKLCYYWYPDGDGGQCGGGASRNLCAGINSMTPYYRDDTDRRGGGCRMKWGLISDGFSHTDAWFSQVQICYQWYADGDGGQCGGGAPRLTCARVGQFTAVYRDDTDRRGGGCRMRWKMAVPNNAPLWIRTAKLCFEWYPDGDGGQCGGGVGRKLCAATNQWTTYYRDDTDRRGGGCQMRWGIIM